MKIMVTVKQVPDTSGKVAVNPDGTLDRASMQTIINPDDMNAVEAALALKDELGCKVIAFTMGPPPAEGMLRELMAMGVDEGVLVTAREFGGSDTFATSQIIAAAIDTYGVDEDDIILAGRQAIDGDTALVAELMGKLNKEGSYTVPADLLEKIQSEFTAYYCDDDRAQEIMGRVYQDYCYLCDPHTASGWAAAEDYISETGDLRAMVVLSTASPYKFPVAVLNAIGGDTSGTEFEQMDRLSEITNVPVPENLANLLGKEEKHTGVIEKDAMLDYVLNL